MQFTPIITLVRRRWEQVTDEMAFIQYIDPDYKMGDQWDDVPAPVLLAIYDKSGKLEFEQTELTYKHLSKRG